MPKRAPMSAATAQDRSRLAELLLANGYEVHGLSHRPSAFHIHRIHHLYKDPRDSDMRLSLPYGNLSERGATRHADVRDQPE